MKGADKDSKDAPESSLPDWTKLEDSAQAAPSLENEDSAVAPSDEAQPAAESDLPSWLASLGQESSETAPEGGTQPVVESDKQDWLASLDDAEATSEEVQPAADSDIPDWLSSLGADSSEAVTAQETEEPAAEGETPDWLSSLGADNTDAVLEQETEELAAEGETPDWLASIGEEAPELEEVPDELEFPTLTSEEPVQGDEVAPSEVTDDQSALTPADDVDALFNIEMPEWLSDAGAQEPEEQALEIKADEAADNLRPAELPSWVQAMRPIEDVISETDGGTIADQPIEEQGPLAGLRGVLPAMPGVRPTSIPEAYSIKLQASEDQQTSAAMLNQMLAAEVHPEPSTTQLIALPQRFLRWIISIVLFLVIGGSVFTGMQINPIPSGVPLATKAFLEDYVQGSLPADAPVLLIFDYEAALAGELDAAAAPLIDYMILQKAPRLSLISSTATGPGLAERFMNLENTQASLYYQAGQQFINLGYLPGGAAGVLAFAENPVTTKPVSIDGEKAWDTPVLQGVSRLSDFAAIILLTDNAETARVWIEQTETAREHAQFLVVSSAQSGPMILPYHQSGQVDVMLTGVDGGAPIEQYNGGRPGTARRYWDAYGMGLLAALVMISFGSLWSLLAGMRVRSREQGEA